MFYGCYSLKSINISIINTESLQNIEKMFANCTCLASVVLSNFEVVYVQSMDKMFYNCFNLKYVDISSFKSKLKQIFLFNNLPSYGEIVVKTSFYNKIQNQIPENWNKTFKK